MKVIANGTPHEIEDKPLTILCHQGGIKMEVPDALKLTPSMTVEFIDRYTSSEQYERIRTNKLYQELFALAWDNPKATMPATWQQLLDGSDDIKHIIGLMVHLHYATSKGVPVFLEYPETHLHPKQQCGLMSMITRILNMHKKDDDHAPTAA